MPAANTSIIVINTATRLDERSGCISITITGTNATAAAINRVLTLSALLLSFVYRVASVRINIIFIISVGWNKTGPSFTHLYTPVSWYLPNGEWVAAVRSTPAI